MSKFRELMFWLYYTDFEFEIRYIYIPESRKMKVARNILGIILSPIALIYFIWDWFFT